MTAPEHVGGRRCSFGVAVFQYEPLRQIVAVVREIERLGYTYIYVGDSQMIWREMFVTLGALAVTTEHVVLGAGVTNPITRHVGVQASAWSSLAELTGGRVVIGLGLGDSALETLGRRPARMSDLRQAVDTIRRLVQGETVALDGTEVRLTHAYGRALPVYIAASGPRMIDLAGGVADGAILLVGTDPELVRVALDRISAAAAVAGRTDRVAKVIWAPFSIGDDGPAARNHVRAHVARAVLHPMPFAFGQEDREAIAQIRARYDYYAHLAQGAPQADVVSDSLVAKFAIAGTPAECLAQVQRLQGMGIDQIGLVPHGPDRLSQLRRLRRARHRAPLTALTGSPVTAFRRGRPSGCAVRAVAAPAGSRTYGPTRARVPQLG